MALARCSVFFILRRLSHHPVEKNIHDHRYYFAISVPLISIDPTCGLRSSQPQALAITDWGTTLRPLDAR
jgi:hypothetical protein